MAEAGLQLEIVTPQEALLEAQVSEFVAPGWLGQFGVLPGHRAMVIALRSGVVTYKTLDGATGKVAIGGGFATVDNDHATILADVAEAAEDIDVERAKAAETQARKSLEGVPLDSPEYPERRAALDRALARMEAAG